MWVALQLIATLGCKSFAGAWCAVTNGAGEITGQPQYCPKRELGWRATNILHNHSTGG